MCAAPIYQAPDPASPAVLAAELVILAQEGPLTVCGFQYATSSDAALARRHEAEYRVRRAARLARAADRPCIWCGRAFAAGDPIVIVGGEPMHVVGCQVQFEAMAYGDEPSATRDEFLCRGGCGRPMRDAGMTCAECGL